MDVAQKIVRALEHDICGRCGLQQEWEQIDAKTQTEIRETWAALIREELAREHRASAKSAEDFEDTGTP